MYTAQWHVVIVCGLLTALHGAPALAKTPADTFHRAYYLEVEKGDLAAAAQLPELFDLDRRRLRDDSPTPNQQRGN